MRLLTALRAGLGATVRAWRPIVGVHLWNLVLAASLGAIVYAGLAASFGSSLAGARMRAGFDPYWYNSFSTQATGVAATFRPSVAGKGAVLDAVDAFFDGFVGLIFSSGSIVVPLALVYLLSWSFLAGGFIARFAGTAAPAGFLGSAGRHFPAMLVVTLTGLLAFWAVLGPLRSWVDGTLETALRENIDERVRFAWIVAEYAGLWTIVWVVKVVLDYAKVLVVVDGPTSVVGAPRAVVRALGIVARHPVRTIGLHAIVGAIWLATTIAYLAVAPDATVSSTNGILAMFLLGQAYIMSRVFIRALTYAGATNIVRSLVALLALLVGAAGASAQENPTDIGTRLLADPVVRAAVDAARNGEPQVLQDQVRLCEIPAPTFHEERRGAVVKAAFEQLGLRNVRVDAIGNVIGERPGRAARPHLLFASHLDTVFPEGTDLTVKREALVYRSPGIGDNCRGLAAMLGVIRALRDARVETPGTITFVANVREEGLGNLGGARHLLEGEFKGRVDRFISMDGSGIGFTYLGVGTERARVTFKGPGGHSYYAFGNANPMHAIGRAMARIGDIQVPKDPRTTFSVGTTGGGTSVNSIAFEAWFEIDMRSHEASALAALSARVRQAVDEALAEENARWGGKGALTVEWTSLGAVAPGAMTADAPIVQATTSVTKALGLPIVLFPSTTDSNVPMSMGIPALTIDGGGDGAGGHSLKEVFDSTDSWKGTQRALLLAIALVQP